MADDVARLVAVMEANLRGFTKGMEDAQRIADRRFGQIEKRMAKSERFLAKGFSGIGKTLLAGGAIIGIERFVKGVGTMADELQNTSDVLKVGTDELQTWGILSGRAGVSQEELNTAVSRFGKSLGEAALKGGNARRELAALGVDVKGTVTQGFYDLADAVAATKDPQQQLAIVTAQLGKTAGGLVPVLALGRAELKRLLEEFLRTGKIMDREAIQKIDDLGDKWGELKRQMTVTGGNILGGFTEEFGKFADELSSPQFQQAMSEFGAFLAQVALLVGKISPFLPQIAGAWAGAKIGRVGGVPGALIGAGVGAAVGGALGPEDIRTAETRLAFLEQQLANVERSGSATDLATRLRGQVAEAQAKVDALRADQARAAQGAASPPPPPGGDRTGAFDFSKIETIDVTPMNAELKELLRTTGIQIGLYRELRETSQDTANARRDAILAETNSLVELSRGTADYYDIVREQIDERTQLEVNAVEDARQRELQRLEDVKNRALAEGVVWEEYEQARINAEATAELAIAQIRTQGAVDRANIDEEQSQTKARAIQINDAVKDGLLDIGLAARHGFGAMEDAASRALSRLGDLVIEMGILRPLLNMAFGDTGTSGGGFLGSIFDGFFASGGTIPRGHWGIAGENGPEPIYSGAMGTRVLPNSSLNSVAPRSGGINITMINQNSFAGAVDANSIKTYAEQVGATSMAAAISWTRQNARGLYLKAVKEMP